MSHRRTCPTKCPCICHDNGGSGHDHPGQPCPGKTGQPMVVDAVQWCPSGSALEAVPGPIIRLLAAPDGRAFGFGHGPGWSTVFGSEHGDVAVEPGQWVLRFSDGSVRVQDEYSIT